MLGYSYLNGSGVVRMITLQQALDDQRDLNKLIQPRFEYHHEIYRPNDNYGFAFILKTYADLPLDCAIMAAIPHGIYLMDKVVPKSELDAPLKAILSYPPYLTPLWKKYAKGKSVIPIASPIHYALKLFNNEVDASNRKGTLFIPPHNTAAVKAKYDIDCAIRILKTLPNEQQPVTVCVHWYDLTQDLHQPYLDAGFNVVCAGHMTDVDHLFRWLHIASMHKQVLCCGIGSSLFYASAMGVPCRLLKEPVTYEPLPNIQLNNKAGKEYTVAGMARINNIQRTFSRCSDQVTAEQTEMTRYMTQADLIQSPDQLKRMLLPVVKNRSSINQNKISA